MPWIEIELSPQTEWNEDGLEDWASALGAFLMQKGTELNPQISILPGYHVFQLGEAGSGEIKLSRSERLVLLNGFTLKGTVEDDFARFLVRFAQQMGAVGVCVSGINLSDGDVWRKLGGIVKTDPVLLEGPIQRKNVGIQQLAKFSLLVTYECQPVLCLEPITCNVHAPGLISLAQRRLEKMYGGGPLGFASRLAVHCPWQVSREQWNDLLSFTRLQAFDLLERMVNPSRFING